MKWLTPESRLKAASWLLVISIVGMVVNVSLYLFKIIDEDMLLLITLILSWLAITFTAVDILSTQDVRKEQDDE